MQCGKGESSAGELGRKRGRLLLAGAAGLHRVRWRIAIARETYNCPQCAGALARAEVRTLAKVLRLERLERLGNTVGGRRVCPEGWVRFREAGSRGPALKKACASEECQAHGWLCWGFSLAPRKCPVALANRVCVTVEEGRGRCGRTSPPPCSQAEHHGSIVGVRPLEASPAPEPDIQQNALPSINIHALETSSCIRQNWRVSITVPIGSGRARSPFLERWEQGLWCQALAALANGAT